jgi:putative restriction endonuclease
VSVYARQSQLIRVEENLAAIHQFNAQLLGETSFAIALPAAALGFYLENIERFHQMNSERSIQDLIQAHVNSFVETGIGTTDEFDAQAGNDRVRFTYERTAYPRDPRFAKRVLGAYGGACCVCGRQLGIVQAAHIIPHSEADCPNTVTNGLAMCIDHHRLYDDALLLPQSGGSLFLNEDRANYLLQIGQGSGLDGVRAIARNGYKVPNRVEHKPLDEYLQRGFDIRLRG